MTLKEARRRYRIWASNRDNYRILNDEKILDCSPSYVENETSHIIDDKNISKNLKRQLKLDKKYQDYNWYVDDVIERLINSFDFSVEVRNNIKSYIKNKSPKDNFDIITSFLDYVSERNPPITSSEIWEQVKQLKVKQKGGVDVFKDRIFKERNYDWYITKTLSKFPSETFKIFQIIKKKYHVYIKIYPESNPINLIKALCYNELKKIDVKCTLKTIGLTGTTSTKYKRRLKGLGL